MASRKHISKQFDADLKSVRMSVLKMGGMVEEEEEFEPLPLAASKQRRGKNAVLEGIIHIEQMGFNEISEELMSWKTHGRVYLAEDGFDDCTGQMDRMVQRCRPSS